MNSAPQLYYSDPVPVPMPSYSDRSQMNYNSCVPSDYRISNDTHRIIDDHIVKQLLAQGFTQGLVHSLADNSIEFPLRLWVVDNSGSMQKTDGHVILESSKPEKIKFADCTRWDEIKEAVNYHMNLSSLLEISTSFRLLNHPGASVGSQQFAIAMDGPQRTTVDIQKATSIMTKTRPSGTTPLTKHVLDIYQSVQSLVPQLNATGKRVTIVLATDGLPTDDSGRSSTFAKQQFTDSLRKLEGLPVWVVIRLCTDEDDVVEFYNQLDDELELNMDVLDDFCGEAMEVNEHNSWLNYALPLHRMREMGYHGTYKSNHFKSLALVVQLRLIFFSYTLILRKIDYLICLTKDHSLKERYEIFVHYCLERITLTVSLIHQLIGKVFY
jgi:hypothetical protein